jgi:hypothetical protein
MSIVGGSFQRVIGNGFFDFGARCGVGVCESVAHLYCAIVRMRS